MIRIYLEHFREHEIYPVFSSTYDICIHISNFGFSLTIFLIAVGLSISFPPFRSRTHLVIDLSLIKRRKYLLKDFNCEGDNSIDLQVCWSIFCYVLPDDLIVNVKARGVRMQGSLTLTQDGTFKVQD